MKYIIFDMDGVIVDSEKIYFEAKTEVLKDAGINKPISYQYQFMGTTYEHMWNEMKEELHLPGTIDFYISEMNKKRSKIMEKEGLSPIRGVVAFIRNLHAHGIVLAVASSSPKAEIISNLEQLNLIDQFDILVGGEEVENSKPHPDIFKKVAQLIGDNPEECIVIEDTKNGSLAAKSAGMYCIGFANQDYPSQDLSVADDIIKSFDITSLNKLLELLSDIN